MCTVSQAEYSLQCSNLSSIAFIIYSVFPLLLFTCSLSSSYSSSHVLFSFLFWMATAPQQHCIQALNSSGSEFDTSSLPHCLPPFVRRGDELKWILASTCSSPDAFSQFYFSGSAAHSLHSHHTVGSALPLSRPLKLLLSVTFLLVIAGSCTWVKLGCNAFLQIGYQ